MSAEFSLVFEFLNTVFFHSYFFLCYSLFIFVYFLSDEGIDVSDGSGLDGEGRIKLFERGLENEKKGKLKSALKCYMACLRGLKPHSNFPLLPQCLRNVCIVSADLCDEFYDCSIIFFGGGVNLF